jgi:hypothetical protein
MEPCESHDFDFEVPSNLQHSELHPNSQTSDVSKFTTLVVSSGSGDGK